LKILKINPPPSNLSKLHSALQYGRENCCFDQQITSSLDKNKIKPIKIALLDKTIDQNFAVKLQSGRKITIGSGNLTSHIVASPFRDSLNIDATLK
jgi:hypothetical protein